jgi:hypothetical protein
MILEGVKPEFGVRHVVNVVRSILAHEHLTWVNRLLREAVITNAATIHGRLLLFGDLLLRGAHTIYAAIVIIDRLAHHVVEVVGALVESLAFDRRSGAHNFNNMVCEPIDDYNCCVDGVCTPKKQVSEEQQSSMDSCCIGDHCFAKKPVDPSQMFMCKDAPDDVDNMTDSELGFDSL